MGPRMWFVNPSWGQTWPTKFDESGDFQLVMKTPSINNQMGIAFPAQGGVYSDGANFLTTTPHAGQFLRLGVGTPNYFAAPKIGDNGRLVLRNETANGNQIYSLTHSLNPAE